MSIYDDLRPVATELLTEFKQGIISYIKITPGNGPIDNPGPSTKTSYPINSTARGATFTYVQGGLALASDLQIVAPVDSRYTPDIKGMVEIDHMPYKIVRILPNPAAGTPVTYTFIVRRGTP